MTWKWELKAILAEVLIYSRARPAYMRFQFGSVGLTVQKAGTNSDENFTWGIAYPDRWFYMVEGAGMGQNGRPPKGVGGQIEGGRSRVK